VVPATPITTTTTTTIYLMF